MIRSLTKRLIQPPWNVSVSHSHLTSPLTRLCSTKMAHIAEEPVFYQIPDEKDSPNVFYRAEQDSLDFDAQTGQFSGDQRGTFVDKLVVCCQAGDGGDGAVSFLSHCKKRGVPDGGDAGDGANVVLRCDGRINGFTFKSRVFRAERGMNGYSKNRTGCQREPLVISVPMGTIVTQLVSYDGDPNLNSVGFRSSHPKDTTRRMDQLPGESPPLLYDGALKDHSNNNNDDDDDPESMEAENIGDHPHSEAKKWQSGALNERKQILCEMVREGQECIVARGGSGGRGNKRLKTTRNNHPRWSERGDFGERVMLELELKCLADVGLVGFPNAGKSSLLGKVSNSQPAVSSFAFTTLNPHIGVVKGRMRWADIPGLVEGSSDDCGLGIEFLRHIERTRVLVFVLDIVGTDGLFEGNDDRNPNSNMDMDMDLDQDRSQKKRRTAVSDFLALRRELAAYDESMLDKPCVIFANKMDIIDEYEKYADLLPDYPPTLDDDHHETSEHSKLSSSLKNNDSTLDDRKQAWKAHVDGQIKDLKAVMHGEGVRIVVGSAAEGTGLDELMRVVWKVLRQTKRRNDKYEGIVTSAMKDWLVSGGVLTFPDRNEVIFSNTDTDTDWESPSGMLHSDGSGSIEQPITPDWGSVSWFDSTSTMPQELTVCQKRMVERAKSRIHRSNPDSSRKSIHIGQVHSAKAEKRLGMGLRRTQILGKLTSD